MVSDAPRSALPLYRLAVIGVVVPLSFVVLDQWLLSQHARYPHNVAGTVGMLATFILQIGLMGYLCGRFTQLSWLRWTFYAWCWILVDLQTLASTLLSVDTYTGESLLARSLLAAQLGLFVIWGTLGTERWVLRLPASLLGGALVALPLLQAPTWWGHDRAIFFLGQSLALLFICSVLRRQGFQLAVSEMTICQPIPNAEQSGAGKGSPSLQFAIRHVLIWTTTLAFMLGILRSLDLLSGSRLMRFSNGEWLGFTTAGLIVAMVLVVALWSALGQGSALLRWCLLVITSTLGGLTLILMEAFFGESSRWLWSTTSKWQFWRYMFFDWWWMIAWCWLAGGLLFAALLIFRTLGYRLTKPISARHEQRIESLPTVPA